MKKIVIKIFLILSLFFVFGSYVFASEYVIYRNSNDGGKIYRKDLNIPGDGIAITVNGGTMPSYSPDGQYIVYKSENGYLIYRKNANDVSDGVAIMNKVAFNPIYSPDGQYIAYRASNLYIKNANDNSEGNPVNSLNTSHLKYSPDGQYIYYTSNNSLYRKNSNDNLNGNLLINNVTYFAISPDGNKIAYTNTSDGLKLYLKNSNDSSIGVNISNISVNTNPTFTGDGQKIIYSNSNDGNKLYIKSINDSLEGTPINNVNSIFPFYYSDSYNNSPINGTCGTNAVSYLSGSTNYSGTFCSSGTPTPTTPSFPLPGQTINWTCVGSNSGTTANCSATKEPLSNVPTNLKQEVQSPELPKEEIPNGIKIGKFQSGSGIILSANISNSGTGQVRLKVELYQSGQTNPIKTFTGSYISGGISEIIIPYSSVGSGEYSWRAKAERNDGASSEWVYFDTNNSSDYDFGYFEGFEPYPYGYRFDNAGPADGTLTGGINKYFDFNPWFYHKEKIDGNKWELFDMAFDTSVFNGNENKKIDAFESVGLNNSGALQGGNCYGLSVSALMQYTHSGFLQTYYPSLSNQIGTGTIWYNVHEPITINQDGYERWNDYNDALKSIYALSITQEGSHNKIAEKNATTTNGNEILTKYINNPNKKYILMFSSRNFLGNVKYGHVVVPYKYEGNRIYFWDNEYKYGENTFKQYIEFNSNGTFSISNSSEYNYLALVDIDDIYNGGQKSSPAGFNETDSMFTLFGNADFYLQDSLGRISGFLNGNILEEIPGVNIVIPYNNTNGQINNFKKIYLAQSQNLSLKVLGKTNESYDLMIAGGNYYTKIEGVETSSGQLDTYLPTRQNLKIDFDNSKTGNYNLMIDNFYNNGTGTIYMDSMPSIGEKQNYDINWSKVINNSNDSVVYSRDIDNDGDYENEQELPPIYQYTIPTMLKINIPNSEKK